MLKTEFECEYYPPTREATFWGPFHAINTLILYTYPDMFLLWGEWPKPQKGLDDLQSIAQFSFQHL